MDRYRWNILGLCEMTWKNAGETKTDEGHKVFFSGKEDKHERGVGFFVHKVIVNTVKGCHPVSSRFITVRLRAVRFNITVVQAYASTSDYDESESESELQSFIVQVYVCQEICLTMHSGKKKNFKNNNNNQTA